MAADRKWPASSLTIRLSDGRTLGYAQYGDPNGATLLYFHGFPSSRLEAADLHLRAANLNIRLLSLDRPGFGLSTHDPRRRITDWPRDVKGFVTQLELVEYAILGYSGGGPYALACAKEPPSSGLSAVGIVACAPTWNRGYRSEDVSWSMRQLHLAVTCFPSATRVTTNALVATLRWVSGTKPARDQLEKSMDDGDQAGTVNSTQSTQKDTSALASLESFAQGGVGFIHEARLLSEDWDIAFSAITHAHVRMWHGVRDSNAPIKNARKTSTQIPQCVWEESDDDHFSIERHFDRFVKQLVRTPNQEPSSRGSA